MVKTWPCYGPNLKGKTNKIFIAPKGIENKWRTGNSFNERSKKILEIHLNRKKYPCLFKMDPLNDLLIHSLLYYQ